MMLPDYRSDKTRLLGPRGAVMESLQPLGWSQAGNLGDDG